MANIQLFISDLHQRTLRESYSEGRTITLLIEKFVLANETWSKCDVTVGFLIPFDRKVFVRLLKNFQENVM